MWTPYDWTRADAEQSTARSHAHHDPVRWVVSTLAAGAVGLVVWLIALFGYVLMEIVTGLADQLPDGLGAISGLGLGIAAAVIAWRGIAKRWNR